MSFFTLQRDPLGDKMNLGQITKDVKCEKKWETECESRERWGVRRAGDGGGAGKQRE